MNAERRQILMHNSKTVIFLDHSNLSGAEYIRCMEQSLKDAKSTPIENRLILINVEGSMMDKETLRTIKQMTAEMSGGISKVAMFGISGIQLFFMRTISAFSKIDIKPFYDRQSAIEWLTK
jgi:hypothetical protein